MARSVDRRSEYWFDPTASEAIARADTGLPRSSAARSLAGNFTCLTGQTTLEGYFGSSEDLKKYSGILFEPDQNRLVKPKHLRRRYWQVRQLGKRNLR